MADDDGRWIVVDGRRWRATDPSIPEPLRVELVAELMAARRAVGAAKRLEDPAAEAAARARVRDAKVALGERGEPWWEPPTPAGSATRVRSAMAALARKRAPATTCPSDAARAVGGERWRSLMAAARDAAVALADEGVVELRQRGEPIDHRLPWRGPVRVAWVGDDPA